MLYATTFRNGSSLIELNPKQVRVLTAMLTVTFFFSSVAFTSLRQIFMHKVHYKTFSNTPFFFTMNGKVRLKLKSCAVVAQPQRLFSKASLSLKQTNCFIAYHKLSRNICFAKHSHVSAEKSTASK